MLFFGKVLAFTPPKIVFLLSIVIFEIGSLLSAVARSVNVLIIGRAISGFGGVGLYVSMLSIAARVCLSSRTSFVPASHESTLVCIDHDAEAETTYNERLWGCLRRVLSHWACDRRRILR